VRDASDGAVGNGGTVGDADVATLGDRIPLLARLVGDESEWTGGNDTVDGPGDPRASELNTGRDYDRDCGE
jgi:hypothetical protein